MLYITNKHTILITNGDVLKFSLTLVLKTLIFSICRMSTRICFHSRVTQINTENELEKERNIRKNESEKEQNIREKELEKEQKSWKDDVKLRNSKDGHNWENSMETKF